VADNAIYALKQWRFEPGRLNGQVVPVKLVNEANFSLKSTLKFTLTMVLEIVTCHLRGAEYVCYFFPSWK